ncbi:hypothetical protein M5W87_09450 [Paenibacillus apiarius]|uniref:Uncharacterized protein n=1 Tax=Paenibacillus apiarius TaxID=46240 RepID=A0ABT4DU27_9BACL|nr:hypothetical protein [Paenibacillus apiarius]MCY9515835.1 hypothetical protein [Paenibacillus apiarius]MCY9520745.1 hypothetical protein [Paenibacillus apiarius]MCY9558027.1 hypothetical protein [Paenibacillus apiarius]MCY9685882.1 hypothetical protein [Paenibacillus apiarius]MCY9724653.1 hypothetical protein [Paenibacillus apiarius]
MCAWTVSVADDTYRIADIEYNLRARLVVRFRRIHNGPAAVADGVLNHLLVAVTNDNGIPSGFHN